MIQGLANILNIDTSEELSAEDKDKVIESMEKAELELLNGTDHEQSTDLIFQEVLKHARDIMDLGFNMEHAKAGRIFEIGNQLYNTALNSKNSKRDAQLKALKLEFDRQKLELAKQDRGLGTALPIETEGKIVEDRNELIKRLREK